MMQTLGNALSEKRNPTSDEPIDQPRLDLRERDQVKTKRPSMWNIVFYNDDYTPMDFVEFVLKKVFHISTLDALALTLVVHTKGKGIAGTYTFEVAEQKQCEVLLMAKIEEHPLRIEVERAGRQVGIPTRPDPSEFRAWRGWVSNNRVTPAFADRAFSVRSPSP